MSEKATAYLMLLFVALLFMVLAIYNTAVGAPAPKEAWGYLMFSTMFSSGLAFLLFTDATEGDQ